MNLELLLGPTNAHTWGCHNSMYVLTQGAKRPETPTEKSEITAGKNVIQYVSIRNKKFDEDPKPARMARAKAGISSNSMKRIKPSMNNQ